MAVEKSSILPEPPPPRPARREAAIEAALRRFDGLEPEAVAEQPAPVHGPWAWLRRPQVKLLVTASLVAAIGLPAALVAIRDGQFAPAEESGPPPVARDSQDDSQYDEARVVESVPPAAAGETPPPPPLRPGPEDRPTTPAEEAAPPDVAPPVVAAAPPPPSAPAPRAPVAQKTEPEDRQILVTGSRIARPNLSTADSLTVARPETSVAERRASEAAAAPDWVLKDPAYRTFLSRLQAAVRASDRESVVRLIAFPLRVNSEGKTRSYRNARSVLEDYDRIFTPDVKRAILDQRFERLFGRDRGVMIGSGQVWFDRTCRNRQCSPPGPVRITAINP